MNCAGYQATANHDRSCLMNLASDRNAHLFHCSKLAIRVHKSELRIDVVQLAAIAQDDLTRAGKIEHAFVVKL